MIDEKQIKEWAEHLCVVPRPPRYIGTCNDYEVKPHTERRELAQIVLTLQVEADAFQKHHDATCGWMARAEKAERELQEQFMHEGALQNENVSLVISLGQAREQRDALAAALAKVVTTYGKYFDAEPYEEILDAHAPGWREK